MAKTNNYRFRELAGRYFVTTDHGSFIILSKQEFDDLCKNVVSEQLEEKLLEKEILLDSHNIQEAIRLTGARYACLSQGTSLHIMVITQKCNLDCVYCQANQGTREHNMSSKTAKKTVDFIFQSPSRAITIEFQGGEPLMNWEIIKEVTEYAFEKNKDAKKDLKITIVTNLSLMDRDKLDFIQKNKISLCTSFDGPKAIHDANRPKKYGSNYDDIVKWLDIIKKEYKKIRMNALVTLTKKSLTDPKGIVSEYIKNDLKSIHLRPANKMGKATHVWDDISYSVDEFLQFWYLAMGYIRMQRKKGVDITERMVGIMLLKIMKENDPNYLDLRSPCGASFGQIAYNYNGDIYVCDEARMLDDDLFKLGNVANMTLKGALKSETACSTFLASINDQYVCNECVYKPYCGVCPVCNYAEHGNVIAHIPSTSRCKIYKAQFDWVVENIIIPEHEKLESAKPQET